MCSGVETRNGDKISKSLFIGVRPRLPVLIANSAEVEWICWGRRKKEMGSGPQGGWARISTVQAGDWEMMQPQRGYALIERFLQKEGSSGTPGRRLSQWVLVPRGQVVECLVVGLGAERRAYIITTTPPVEFQRFRDRWPLMVDLQPHALLVDTVTVPTS